MYRVIDKRFWRDEKVMDLTPLGKLLLVYYITNPYAHFSGIYSLPGVLITDETGLAGDDIEKLRAGLVEIGLIEYDDQAEIVWVKNMLLYQTRRRTKKMGNVIRDHLRDLPGNSPLISRFQSYYHKLGIPSPHPHGFTYLSRSAGDSEKLQTLFTEKIVTRFHPLPDPDPDPDPVKCSLDLNSNVVVDQDSGKSVRPGGAPSNGPGSLAGGNPCSSPPRQAPPGRCLPAKNPGELGSPLSTQEKPRAPGGRVPSTSRVSRGSYQKLFKEFIKGYNQEDYPVLQRTFKLIATTRKSGRVANSVKAKLILKLMEYPPLIVTEACRIYNLKECANNGKDEKYLIGIIRGLHKNQKKKSLEKIIRNSIDPEKQIWMNGKVWDREVVESMAFDVSEALARGVSDPEKVEIVQQARMERPQWDWP